ncbi:unnamed protein product [Nesidiocoris tenuis]|uniref:Uncharacterized protein n=1 Tax=Nesidiocoris tenuis TaxID=355587 RepID=A0A6H5H0W5_9HEMI|nr:unnamed protein product [Nesidiocoris tenuis]
MIAGVGLVAGAVVFTPRIRRVHTLVIHPRTVITTRRFTLIGAVYEWEEAGEEFRGDRLVTPVVSRSRSVVDKDVFLVCAILDPTKCCSPATIDNESWLDNPDR